MLPMKPGPWGEPVELYDGPILFGIGREPHECGRGHGRVLLNWLPKPDVVLHYDVSGPASGYTISHPDVKIRFPEVQLHDQEEWQPPDDIDDSPNVRANGIKRLTNRAFGDPSAIHHATLMVVNWIDWDMSLVTMPTYGQTRSTIEMTAGPWKIEIEALHEERLDREQVFAAGGFIWTHQLTIERRDGSTFPWEEAEPIVHLIFLWMGFVRGQLAGIMLPRGFDADGNLVYLEWQASAVDQWSSDFTWCDPTVLLEVTLLLERWLELAQDPLWEAVLRRSVRLLLAANAPQLIESAVPVVHTALETLAWTVLVVSEGWLRENDDLDAASNLRLLMRWAGIETEIPEHLTALARYPSGVRDPDLPIALTQVRNRLVHPKRKTGSKNSTVVELETPSVEVLVEAWNANLAVCELVILRVLGYQGGYHDRRSKDGHWVGATQPVPWAVPDGT